MQENPSDWQGVDDLDKTPRTGVANTFTHQLRTPLTAITGYLSLLRDGAFGSLSAEQLDVVGIISKNLRRVNLLLDDLKDLQHIERGTIILSRSLIALDELLKPLVRELAILADEKSLKFTVMTGEDLKVFVDVEAIRRALLHVFQNAINYTSGGEIRIKAAPDGPAIVIEVIDTGVGIDDEDMSSIFIKYYRSSKSYIRESPGAGIGLYIARALLEANAGSIDIDSKPGSGTVATIRLPVVPRQ